MPGDASAFDILSVCLAPTLQHTMLFDRFLPREVNRAREFWLDASGKGVNACRAVLACGGTCLHLTHSGEPGAALFRRLCAEDGIPLETVDAPDCGIRTCTTAVDASTGAATELVEECPAVPPGTWEGISERFNALLPSCAAVILSGKAAAGYPPEAMTQLALSAVEAGKGLVLDIRGEDLRSTIQALSKLEGSIKRAHIVAKPNASEFASTLECETDGIREQAAALSASSGIDFLITNGPRAALLVSGGVVTELQPPAVKALNPIGSGDAVAGALAFHLVRGLSLEKAARESLELGSRNAATARPARF